MLRRWRLKYPESPGNPAGMGAGSSLQNAVWGDQPLRHGQFQSLQDPSLFRLGAGYATEDQFLAVGRPPQDVADLNVAELAEDDLRCHPPRLGRRSGPARIGFADLGHQTRSLGQV